MRESVDPSGWKATNRGSCSSAITGLRSLIHVPSQGRAAERAVLAPFGSSDPTVVVDDLEEAVTAAQQAGPNINRDRVDQAAGRNITLTFQAGPVIEFVEWNGEVRAAAGIGPAGYAHAPPASRRPVDTGLRHGLADILYIA